MNTNPWLTEQVMRSRMDDLERRTARLAAQATAYPRASWSGRLGEMLIRVGRRLAGPEVATKVLAQPGLMVRPEPGQAGAGC